eukprot:2870697-Pleurochrysis_carterae.AAC.2
MLPAHIAANRSLFRNLFCFLHTLGYGRNVGKVRFNADSRSSSSLSTTTSANVSLARPCPA